MEIKAVEAIIKRLEYIQKRQAMYISNHLAPTTNFINGFHAACNSLGISAEYDRDYERVVIDRGWKPTAMGIEDELKERGLTEDEIANELITIELQVWKLRLEKILETK